MLQKRTNFIKSVSVDGVNEKDLLLNAFSRYTWSRGMYTYELSYDDYMRPDLISIKVYGTDQYWWIILKANPGFDDLYNDFVLDGVGEEEYKDAYRIGSTINIPHPLDLKDFLSFSKNFIEQTNS